MSASCFFRRYIVISSKHTAIIKFANVGHHASALLLKTDQADWPNGDDTQRYTKYRTMTESLSLQIHRRNARSKCITVLKTRRYFTSTVCFPRSVPFSTRPWNLKAQTLHCSDKPNLCKNQWCWVRIKQVVSGSEPSVERCRETRYVSGIQLWSTVKIQFLAK